MLPAGTISFATDGWNSCGSWVLWLVHQKSRSEKHCRDCRHFSPLVRKTSMFSSFSSIFRVFSTKCAALYPLCWFCPGASEWRASLLPHSRCGVVQPQGAQGHETAPWNRVLQLQAGAKPMVGRWGAQGWWSTAPETRSVQPERCNMTGMTGARCVLPEMFRVVGVSAWYVHWDVVEPPVWLYALLGVALSDWSRDGPW